jgi:hypothetical protein
MKPEITNALNRASELVDADGRTRFVTVLGASSVTTTKLPERQSFYEVHANGIRQHAWSRLENRFAVKAFGGVALQAPGDE